MLTDVDVRNVYLGVLGREPESDAVVAAHRANCDNVPDLIRNFLHSGEYRSRHPLRTAGDALYDGIGDGDEALLRRYLVQTQSEDGYVKNFVGTRMRVSHADPLTSFSGVCLNDIPTLLADYHAEPIEYVGTLRAIEAGSGAFVGVELGAGWGSWVTTAGHVARRAGRTPIRLYAVEAVAGKVANMRVHLADNGFDPDEHTLVNAIVGPIDGFAFFPITDVTGEWGSSAVFAETDEERPGYERIRSISLATLLKDEPLVDFVHFDIQGAEADVIEASAAFLTGKVRYMVVGTHSRTIEGRIMDVLRHHGWLLVSEQPARMKYPANGPEYAVADGTQVWRNPALSGTARHHG